MSGRVRYMDLPERLRERRPLLGLLGTMRTWLGIASCVAIVAWTRHPAAWLAAVLLIGVFQYHFTVLGHHGFHYDLALTRRANDLICRWLVVAPLLLPMTTMRYTHLRHHKRLGESDDLDRWYYDLTLLSRRSGGRLLTWMTSMFCGGLIIPSLKKLSGGSLDPSLDVPEDQPRASLADVTSVAVSQVAIFGAMWLATGAWWACAVLWLLPVFTVMAGLSSARTCLEHANHENPPEYDLSFRSNPIERFLLAPFNMNYHAEHHRFASVPYYALPGVRAELLAREDYGEAKLLSSYLARLAALYTDSRARG